MKFRGLVLLGVGVALLGGCGLQPDGAYLGAPYPQLASMQSAPTTGNAGLDGSVPPASAFTTVSGTVTEIEPDHQGRLQHQVFLFQETSPDQDTLEVDNDITVGERVPVSVGEPLVIRGVLYHDPGKDGIHWTHHASMPGDAGWIQTPDGTIYQ